MEKSSLLKFHLFLCLYLIILMMWSYIGCFEFITYLMEIAPAVIGMIVIGIMYRNFRFTKFTLIFIALEMTVLIVGAHYSYAKMPLFDYFKEIFGWSRNHYDRLGHLIQGITPALIAREILIRMKVVKTSGYWTFWISLFVALSVSAIYEIIEFITAHILGEEADAFLGSQGDVWDSHWDMTWALTGAFAGLLCFSNAQDRAIEALNKIAE